MERCLRCGNLALVVGVGGKYDWMKINRRLTSSKFLWRLIDCLLFDQTEEHFKVPIGTIRCTVLIETLGGGLEMEEYLYELRHHIVGLNAGRWDYIFSAIKMMRHSGDSVLPDRSQVTMTVPFMRAYTNRLVKVCHSRGAHAIGGMSAFIPSSDKSQNEFAFSKISEDKTREVKDGFDGSWVAHPKMVEQARKIFEINLKNAPHQKHVLREDIKVSERDIINLKVDSNKFIFIQSSCINNLSFKRAHHRGRSER